MIFELLFIIHDNEMLCSIVSSTSSIIHAWVFSLCFALTQTDFSVAPGDLGGFFLTTDAREIAKHTNHWCVSFSCLGLTLSLTQHFTHL